MGLGRSDGMDGVRQGKSGLAVRGREEGDRNGNAPPGEPCSGGGHLLPGGGCTPSIFAIKGISPLDPYRQTPLSNKKGSKKPSIFTSYEVVLKHKSICLTRSPFSW